MQSFTLYQKCVRGTNLRGMHADEFGGLAERRTDRATVLYRTL